MTPENIISVLGLIAIGAGAYAAVRADLATLHERIKGTDKRITDHIETLHHRRINDVQET